MINQFVSAHLIDSHRTCKFNDFIQGLSKWGSVPPPPLSRTTLPLIIFYVMLFYNQGYNVSLLLSSSKLAVVQSEFGSSTRTCFPAWCWEVFYSCHQTSPLINNHHTNEAVYETWLNKTEWKIPRMKTGATWWRRRKQIRHIECCVDRRSLRPRPCEMIQWLCLRCNTMYKVKLGTERLEFNNLLKHFPQQVFPSGSRSGVTVTPAAAAGWWWGYWLPTGLRSDVSTYWCLSPPTCSQDLMLSHSGWRHDVLEQLPPLRWLHSLLTFVPPSSPPSPLSLWVSKAPEQLKLGRTSLLFGYSEIEAPDRGQRSRRPPLTAPPLFSQQPVILLHLLPRSFFQESCFWFAISRDLLSSSSSPSSRCFSVLSPVLGEAVTQSP